MKYFLSALAILTVGLILYILIYAEDQWLDSDEYDDLVNK